MNQIDIDMLIKKSKKNRIKYEKNYLKRKAYVKNFMKKNGYSFGKLPEKSDFYVNKIKGLKDPLWIELAREEKELNKISAEINRKLWDSEIDEDCRLLNFDVQVLLYYNRKVCSNKPVLDIMEV